MNEMLFNHGSIELKDNHFIIPLSFSKTKREIIFELTKSLEKIIENQKVIIRIKN